MINNNPRLYKQAVDDWKPDWLKDVFKWYGAAPNKTYADRSSEWIYNQLGLSDFYKNNSNLGQGFVHLGIPTIAGTVLWGIHSALSDKKNKPSYWSYLLPMLGIGGLAWYLGNQYTPKDIYGNPSNTTPGATGNASGAAGGGNAQAPAKPPTKTQPPPSTQPNQSAAPGEKH